MDHPILGDRFYAHEGALNASDRLRLHSKTVTIMHPIKKEKITFDSDVPF
jgi:tRNA pseudouridine32 synthase/23S rRNA pseudouridine746 synthase